VRGMVGMGDDRGARGVVTAGARVQDGVRWLVSMMAHVRWQGGMVSVMAWVQARACARWHEGYSAGACMGATV